MFKNNLKVAFRQISKNKSYSLLNVVALAIGLAICLHILLYALDELNYDNYHNAVDQIFRLIQESPRDPNEKIALAPWPAAGLLEQKLSQIESSVRLVKQTGPVVRINAEQLYWEPENYYKADPALFQIFNIPFLYGDSASALESPDAVLISKELAQKYYGTNDVLGKTINFDQKDWKVTGVYADIPPNSHLPKFKIVTCLENKYILSSDSWQQPFCATYLKTTLHANIKELADEINLTLLEFAPKQEVENLQVFLQPVRKIHLESSLGLEYADIGNPANIGIFMIIAITVLGMACLNFINLSSARSSTRAKEIGIRKTSGARQSQLVTLFMTETGILVCIALLMAILIVEISLPQVNLITEKSISLSTLLHPKTLLLFLLIGGITIILSGLYPSFILAGMKPIDTLRKIFPASFGGEHFRHFLVVLEFIAAAILLSCMLIISGQIHFIQTADLGFQKERMLVIPMQNATMAQQFQTNFETIKTEFTRHHSVLSATAQVAPPGHENLTVDVDFNGKKYPFINFQFVDKDYVTTYQLQLLAGQNYTQDMAANNNVNFILNETALKTFGITEPAAALGIPISVWIWQGTITSVVKDFHYTSLHHQVAPLLLANLPFNPESLTLHLAPDDITGTLAFLQQRWKTIFPNNPFEYYFLDKDFNQQYQKDDQFSKIVRILSYLAMIIACLGLFGLAAYTADQKTKEIGIRKTMGASILEIFILLSARFLRWVIIANLIAWPITWFIMNRWLDNFAYHINLHWRIFLLSGLITLVIALLTVSYQSIKTAVTKPVDSLRYE